MHELFTKVLSKRDLSRAGDLFSVADYEIVNDLTQVVSGFDSLFFFCKYLFVHISFTRIMRRSAKIVRSIFNGN